MNRAGWRRVRRGLAKSQTRVGEDTDDAGEAAPDATVTHITVRSDHLFLDSLETETAKVRFDAIANADRDNDRDVTLDELAAVQLSSLPMGQYSTGGRATVTDLRAFVTALTASMGHLNGEGLCESSAIN